MPHDTRNPYRQAPPVHFHDGGMGREESSRFHFIDGMGWGGIGAGTRDFSFEAETTWRAPGEQRASRYMYSYPVVCALHSFQRKCGSCWVIFRTNGYLSSAFSNLNFLRPVGPAFPARFHAGLSHIGERETERDARSPLITTTHTHSRAYFYTQARGVGTTSPCSTAALLWTPSRPRG